MLHLAAINFLVNVQIFFEMNYSHRGYINGKKRTFTKLMQLPHFIYHPLEEEDERIKCNTTPKENRVIVDWTKTNVKTIEEHPKGCQIEHS